VGQRLFWDIDDPAACEGSREERLACFRQARDEVERRIKDWLAEQGYDVEE
jgi:arsenate reductase